MNAKHVRESARNACRTTRIELMVYCSRANTLNLFKIRAKLDLREQNLQKPCLAIRLKYFCRKFAF
jgi:hypothetical protein